MGGPPSITVSALSRDTWTSEGFAFPFEEVLIFAFRTGGPAFEPRKLSPQGVPRSSRSLRRAGSTNTGSEMFLRALCSGQSIAK
jgi:hypothetical protein